MTSHHILLVLLVLTGAYYNLVKCELYHIIPSSGDSCPTEQRCLTLSQFATNTSSFLDSTSTVLVLVPGNHTLDATLTAESAQSFTMISNLTILQSETTNFNLDASINCEYFSSLEFINISHVHISGIEFHGCGGNQIELVNNFTLEQCSFHGQEANGTALEFVKANARITSVDFLSYYSNHTLGGAITAKQSSVSILNSTFGRNAATRGGAIYTRQGCIINVTNSSFVQNRALSIDGHFSGHGGAIYAEHSILHSSFVQFGYNHADKDGGAVQALGSIIRCYNDHFYGNTASRNGGVMSLLSTRNIVHYNTDKDGGDVLTLSSTISTFSDHFYGSKSSQNRGAIHFTISRSQIHTNKSHFYNNRAGGGGGVMWIFQSMMNSNNDQFYNNSANEDGGIVRAHHSQISSNNDYFFRNRAGRNGGIMWVQQHSTVNTRSDSYYNNRVGGSGGVMKANQCAIHSNNNSYSNNVAGKNGGVMLADGSTFNSTNDYFSSNRANHTGGCMRVTRSTITSFNVTYHNNSARRSGVLHITRSTLISNKNCFHLNRAYRNGGVIVARKSGIYSSNSNFHNQSARMGGVIWARRSMINSTNDNFYNNIASRDGGVILANLQCIIYIQRNRFYNNKAGRNGGTVFSSLSLTIYSNSNHFTNNSAGSNGGVVYALFYGMDSNSDDFTNNSAGNAGGVMYFFRVKTTFLMSNASRNTAGRNGGIFRLLHGTLQINKGNFSNSSAKYGGAVSADHLSLVLDNSTFVDMKAEMGSVLHMCGSKIHTGNVSLSHNSATTAVVYLKDSTAHMSGNTTITDNKGSLVVIMSRLIFSQSVTFTRGKVSDPVQHFSKIQEGGALTTIQSNVVFHGECKFSNSLARNGGAILSINSGISLHGQMTIVNNSATESGGGVYMHSSKLTCQHHSTVLLLDNTATTSGGGINAVSSSINLKGSKSLGNMFTEAKLQFTGNQAKLGGGVYLALESVIYVHKYVASKHSYPILKFTANSADYGGAVFIPDNTDFGVCTEFENKTHYIANECPLQVLSLYDTAAEDTCHCNVSNRNVYFSRNTAQNSGSSLYGRLLDKCSISNLAEGNITNYTDTYSTFFPMEGLQVHGTSYLQAISDIHRPGMGSPAEKLCFCRDNKPDCSYQYPPLYADREQTILLALLDEVDNVVTNEVENSVRAFLTRNGSFLHQHKKYGHNVDRKGHCFNFTFTAFSIHNLDYLNLYVDPDTTCKHLEPQQLQLTLQFPSCDNCPVGFERVKDQELGCRCNCHSDIKDYFLNCNSMNQTLQKVRNGWIAYINDTEDRSGFLVHPHCPLDYCIPTESAQVILNFNKDNGADAQCANNRSGILCGVCSLDLSLSLGSSRCLSCPRLWPLMTVFLVTLSGLAGIALVALLFVLNLTVAVGTLNGVIFYANIVAANSKILLPFSAPNFVTVFIAWLNMELGLDACFFEGMDVYWKTWLQIAFPTYVIFLVIMIIVISEYSTRFAHIIGKRNPVAILTTLILLSYAKFLHTIIAALSSAKIQYPDGHQEIMWLPDATVSYLRGKHIFLFIVAILILLLGITYTSLLFSWQWILRYQNKAIFKWVRNQKLCQFLEPYHAPYSFKHRYWTGLLLLIRVLLYTISATNVTGDPRVALVSNICLVGFLPLLKGFLVIQVYRKTPIDLLETFTYFNLLTLSVFSWYSLEADPHAQKAVAYTSVSITFVLLMAVILYHTYNHTGVFSKLKESAHFRAFLAKCQTGKKQPRTQDEDENLPEVDKLLNNKAKPTCTVVEIHIPQLQRPESQSALDKNRSIPIVEPNVSQIYTQTYEEEASHYFIPQCNKLTDELSVTDSSMQARETSSEVENVDDHTHTHSLYGTKVNYKKDHCAEDNKTINN